MLYPHLTFSFGLLASMTVVGSCLWNATKVFTEVANGGCSSFGNSRLFCCFLVHLESERKQEKGIESKPTC